MPLYVDFSISSGFLGISLVPIGLFLLVSLVPLLFYSMYIAGPAVGPFLYLSLFSLLVHFSIYRWSHSRSISPYITLRHVSLIPPYVYFSVHRVPTRALFLPLVHSPYISSPTVVHFSAYRFPSIPVTLVRL